LRGRAAQAQRSAAIATRGKVSNMQLPLVANIIIVLAALAFSLFFGFKATDIFEVATAGKSRAWKFHQFWLILVGSASGWIALWFVARKAYFCSQEGCPTRPSFWYGIMLFIAFIGITGFLPITVVGIIQGIKELSAKVIGFAK
jgi:hypothetical protein